MTPDGDRYRELLHRRLTLPASMPFDPKLRELGRMLGISQTHALGLVVRIWTLATLEALRDLDRHGRTTDVHLKRRGYKTHDLAEWCGWYKDDVVFVSSLLATGILVGTDWIVSEWWDTNGAALRALARKRA